MNRIVRGVLVAGVVASIAAGGAQAQARGYIGFGGGVSIPSGDFADGVSTGWLGQVVAGITGPTGKIGGRINGSYTRHSFDTPLDDDPNIRYIGVMGDVVFSPGSGEAKLRPYLLGGLGFQNGKTNTVTAQGETDFAFNLGGGVNFAMGRMKLFIEGRWLSVRSDPGSANMIPISVGLRFGGN
jgi:hypothetical protein